MWVLDFITDVLHRVTWQDSSSKKGAAKDGKRASSVRYILQGKRAMNLHMPASAQFATFGVPARQLQPRKKIYPPCAQAGTSWWKPAVSKRMSRR